MVIGLVNTRVSIIWAGLFREIHPKATVIEINVGDDLVDSLLAVDVVVFTGGPDVDPKLYDEPHNRATVASARKCDLHELSVTRLAKDFGIPMIGICRGAQLLCVANKGKLVQDINNHTGKHMMQTKDNKSFLVSSTHHQMMVPVGDYAVLGWAEEVTSWEGMPKEFIQTRAGLSGKDMEVVFWPESNSLGVQYHPEYMDKRDEGYKYFVEIVKDMLQDALANAS